MVLWPNTSAIREKKISSKWALSPGRSGSPPVESKGVSLPYSNMKPPTSPSKGKLPPMSPSRTKGVGNLINLGLDLFKSMLEPVVSFFEKVKERLHDFEQYLEIYKCLDVLNRGIITRLQLNSL